MAFKGKFTREEITRKGLELVGYSGEARSQMLEALELAKVKKFKDIENLLQLAEESLVLAHKSQTEMLVMEANGEYSDITLIMVHGQDHLMTTMLLKDLIRTLIDVYRK